MTAQKDTALRDRRRQDDDEAVGPHRRSPNALTMAERALFLDTLAEACNVAAAAAVTGRAAKTFYGLRRRDPHFAEQWIAALTIGYEAVEARLVDYAMSRTMGRASDAVVDGSGCGGDQADTTARAIPIPGTGLVSGRNPTMAGVPPEIQVGLLLLGRHHATLDRGKPMRRGRRVATAAETDAVLNKRLDQLAQSVGRRQ